MSATLSVVVVSYQSRDLLAACLASLLRASPEGGLEAIVVDNASTDGSVDLLRERAGDVRVVLNPGNVGFARAANQGLAAAGGEYVAFLNSDAEALPGAFDRLIAVLRSSPAAGAVGPRTVLRDGTPIRSCFRFPTLARPFLDLPGLRRVLSESRVRLAYADWDPAATREVDWISGACLLARRDLLARLGGFDDAFFMYFEDTDLCLRMRRAGLAVLYVGGATVIHHTRGSTTGVLTPALFLAEQRSRLHFFGKNHGRGAALAVRAMAASAALVRIVGRTISRAPARGHRSLAVDLQIVRDALSPSRRHAVSGSR